MLENTGECVSVLVRPLSRGTRQSIWRSSSCHPLQAAMVRVPVLGEGVLEAGSDAVTRTRREPGWSEASPSIAWTNRPAHRPIAVMRRPFFLLEARAAFEGVLPLRSAWPARGTTSKTNEGNRP